jgi:hypothetical protein
VQYLCHFKQKIVPFKKFLQPTLACVEALDSNLFCSFNWHISLDTTQTAAEESVSSASKFCFLLMKSLPVTDTL